MLFYVVKLVDGTLTNLPAWMTDAAVCKGMAISDSPVVSLDSLTTLWEIIQIWKENHRPASTPPSATMLEGDGHEGQAKGSGNWS